MGLLIFAFRKLFLKRRINQLNGRQMQLSQAKQRITEQIGLIQRNKASAQSAFSYMMQNAAYQNTSIFQSQINSYTQGVMQANSIYEEARKADPNSDTTKQAKESLDQARAAASANGNQLYSDYMNSQNLLAMKSNAMGQSMDASDAGELQRLKDQDTQLELETASNESMLKELSGELDNVEKAEGDAAKKEAPTFGQG